MHAYLTEITTIRSRWENLFLYLYSPEKQQESVMYQMSHINAKMLPRGNEDINNISVQVLFCAPKPEVIPR